MLRFHGGDGTVVLRVYGGDRGAQGLWWGYQCSGSMVGIGVLRFYGWDNSAHHVPCWGWYSSAQGLWWG